MKWNVQDSREPDSVALFGKQKCPVGLVMGSTVHRCPVENGAIGVRASAKFTSESSAPLPNRSVFYTPGTTKTPALPNLPFRRRTACFWIREEIT